MDWYDVALIVFAHFVGDFVLQTDWMAKNKSRSDQALLAHVGTYCATLVAFVLAYGFARSLTHDQVGFLLTWAAFNSWVHAIVDYVTSRINSRLWERGDLHDFFVGVGLDQSVHVFFLFATWSVH